MNPLDAVLTALQSHGGEVKRERAGQWQARCPAHDDKRASLSVGEGSDGTVLLRCHAGCETREILDRLGLRLADLFPAAGRQPGKAKRREVARYVYQAADGSEVFAVHRFEPKGFRQSRPGPDGKRVWSVKGIRPVTYRLPEVREAIEAGRAIVVVEGEKDSNRLADLGLAATCNHGGAGKWRPEHTECLKGAARVLVLPDNDEPGRQHADAVARSLTEAGVPVKALELPDLPDKGDVTDWLDAGHDVAELRELAVAAPFYETPPTPAATDESGIEPAAAATRPEVEVTTDMPAVIDAAESALLALPEKPIYQRAGHLVRVTRDAKPPRFLDRPAGAPSIEALPLDYLRELLSHAARWLVFDGRKGETKPTCPPAWAARGLLARPRGAWCFPPLHTVTSEPTLRPDGEILDAPGYDADSGILFLPEPGQTWPAIPQKPTHGDAREALNLLSEPLCDFPFAEPCDRSAAIAAILTCAGRPAVLGPVPAFVVSSSTPGSGKGLLADVVAVIASGRAPSRMPQAADDREEAKRLMALAVAGDPIVLVDNVGRQLGSPALDAALTAGEISDRLLGESRIIKAPWDAVLLATGNNITYRTDTGRRVVPIEIDPAVEKPDERTGFRHDPLLPWVRRHRPRLLAAALTVLRAFHVAGRPRQGVGAIGSFESWSTLIREALVWAGWPDPAAGRERIRSEADPAREALGVVLAGWMERWGDRPLSVRDIASELNEAGGDAAVLRDAFGALGRRYDGKLSGRALGYSLRHNQKRVVRGLRLERAGVAHGGVSLWTVRGGGGDGGHGGDPHTPTREMSGDEEDIKNRERGPSPPSPPSPPSIEALAARLSDLGSRVNGNQESRRLLEQATEALDAGDAGRLESLLDAAEAEL